MKVAYTDKLISQEAIDLLKQSDLEVEFNQSPDNCDAIVTRSYTRIDKTLLDKNPNLKHVVACTAGLDYIDLQECGSRAIRIFSAAGSNANAVAEHAVGLILSVLRKISHADSETKSLKWNRNDFLSFELKGKTLGLFGMGAIGKLVSKKLASFGVKTIAFDPYLTKEQIEAESAEKVETKQDLIRNSDIISIHMPLTPETKNFISDQEFSMMKPQTIIINTSRGGIVDEESLYTHLKEGKIWGAALDVLETEPIQQNKLVELNNVILTPHIATMTEEAIREGSLQPVKQFLEAINK